MMTFILYSNFILNVRLISNRLEVQADVTSTQRFSLCSETASATTSLSEKSVNASIALDDGAASTRALAGSVLNFKVLCMSLTIFYNLTITFQVLDSPKKH